MAYLNDVESTNSYDPALNVTHLRLMFESLNRWRIPDKSSTFHRLHKTSNTAPPFTRCSTITGPAGRLLAVKLQSDDIATLNLKCCGHQFLSDRTTLEN